MNTCRDTVWAGPLGITETVERELGSTMWSLFGKRRTALPAGAEIRSDASNDGGVPLVPPHCVLEDQHELITLIRGCAVVKAADFEQALMPLLVNLARYVHMLPASHDHHHTELQGLLRHSLEVGYYAHRLAKGKIFTDSPNPERRHTVEPRWRLAAFLAGLLHDVTVVTRVDVWDGTCRLRWDPFVEPLYDWASARSLQRYHHRWQPQHQVSANPPKTFALLDHVVPRSLLGDLLRADPAIVAALRLALAPPDAGSGNMLGDLVAGANAHSVDRYLAGARAILGDDRAPLSPERQLLRIMRVLLRQRWTINQRGGTVFIASEGVFLVWQLAARDLADALARESVPGMPALPDALADRLVECGIAQAHVSADGTRARYWTVRAKLGVRATSRLTCVLVPRTDLLFDRLPASRVELEVVDSVTCEEPDSDVATFTEGVQGDTRPAQAQQRSDPPPGVPPSSRPPAVLCDTPNVAEARLRDDPTKRAEDLAELRAWAAQHGAAGAFVACLAEDLFQKKLDRGHDYRVMNGHFAYRTPHLPKRHRFGVEMLLGALEKTGWIEIDPTEPLVKVRTITGDPTQQFVVLREIVSAPLMRFLDQRHRKKPKPKQARASAHPPVPSHTFERTAAHPLLLRFLTAIDGQSSGRMALLERHGDELHVRCPQAKNWFIKRNHDVASRRLIDAMKASEAVIHTEDGGIVEAFGDHRIMRVRQSMLPGASP
jgi:conjugal transfer pilus assembly protein TraI